MFRARIPCLTISVMSENVDFIKNVPTHILEVIVTSKRILSCVPARNLEMLLSQQVGLSKVSLFSLMNAFTKMPRDKLSLKMMRLIIMEQVYLELSAKQINDFDPLISRPRTSRRGSSLVNEYNSIEVSLKKILSNV